MLSIETGLEINVFVFKAYCGLVASHISKRIRIVLSRNAPEELVWNGVAQGVALLLSWLQFIVWPLALQTLTPQHGAIFQREIHSN